MLDNISPQTKKFAELFNSNYDVFPWIDQDVVGLSILKEYPVNGLFKPAKDTTGKNDSVAMVRLGYKPNSKEADQLIVSIHKSSRYLFDHNNYDFNDKKSPTIDSLNESKNSVQPIDLEDVTRFQFHHKEEKIYDLENKKYIFPKELVEEIFEQHIETLRAVTFRAKMNLQKKIIDISFSVNKFLESLIFIISGKQIKTTTAMSVGIYTPYSLNDLVGLITEKIPIFNTYIPGTKQSVRTFVIFIFLLFVLNYYLKFDFLGLMALYKEANKSNLFLAVLATVNVYIFGEILPIILLFIMNIIINIRVKATNWKIKYRKEKLRFLPNKVIAYLINLSHPAR